MAEINLPRLEKLAGGSDFRDQLTADECAGLAVWYVLGGNYTEISKLIKKRSRSEFLNRELRFLAEQLQQEELGPQMAATRMLETAHKALKEGDWRKATDTVDQIHQQLVGIGYLTAPSEELDEPLKYSRLNGLQLFSC